MKKITMFRVGISLIPILILVTLLALNISIFGSDAILGASQVALLFSAGVAIWLAMWLFKVPWQDFEETIKSNIGDVTTAIVILFLIGAISGTWTVSGIVPTFIYYGVKIISPKVFLLTACIICALVSVTIGSSWTTIATIGVALLGIGKALGFSDGMIAGAIISGAYFGQDLTSLGHHRAGLVYEQGPYVRSHPLPDVHDGPVNRHHARHIHNPWILPLRERFFLDQ